MIQFFISPDQTVYAVQSSTPLNPEDGEKLNWLFGDALMSDFPILKGFYVGPRAAMVTPWSTNAVEITQNMGVNGIIRIEKFIESSEDANGYDPMLFQKYVSLHQDIL
jgi:phosphoribosylformylglycinamidine synthase